MLLVVVSSGLVMLFLYFPGTNGGDSEKEDEGLA